MVRVCKNSIYHPPTNNIAIAALEQQMYLTLAIQLLGLVKKISYLARFIKLYGKGTIYYVTYFLPKVTYVRKRHNIIKLCYVYNCTTLICLKNSLLMSGLLNESPVLV